MVTLKELCEKINMPHEAKERILEVDERIDLGTIKESVNKLFIKTSWAEGLEELRQSLGEDEHGFKMLTVMLNAGRQTFENYRKKGISEIIFYQTFQCFSRFVSEYKTTYGEYGFDRAFWTPRQISMMEFRLGELEFEITSVDDKEVISIHIPSDAKIGKQIQWECYKNAVLFFEKNYPEYKYEHFICDSWMLYPTLKDVLSPTSRIIEFQNDYEIVKTNPDNKEYMEWVYKNKKIPLEELPEDTSLQRNLKKHLLSGGEMGNAFGYLKITL